MPPSCKKTLNSLRKTALVTSFRDLMLILALSKMFWQQIFRLLSDPEFSSSRLSSCYSFCRQSSLAPLWLACSPSLSSRLSTGVSWRRLESKFQLKRPNSQLRLTKPCPTSALSRPFQMKTKKTESSKNSLTMSTNLDLRRLDGLQYSSSLISSACTVPWLSSFTLLTSCMWRKW